MNALARPSRVRQQRDNRVIPASPTGQGAQLLRKIAESLSLEEDNLGPKNVMFLALSLDVRKEIGYMKHE